MPSGRECQRILRKKDRESVPILAQLPKKHDDARCSAARVVRYGWFFSFL
jgi:hypothetical protein